MVTNFFVFQKYQFKHDRASKPLSLRIYECHVGIATEEPKVGTYKEFGTKIIPRIVKQGKTSACSNFADFICNYFFNKTHVSLYCYKANQKLMPYLISLPLNWKLFLESKLTPVVTVVCSCLGFAADFKHLSVITFYVFLQYQYIYMCLIGH